MNTTASSTLSQIYKLVELEEAGKTFIFSDFDGCGSYTSVRSAVTRLCDKKVLTRLCQGVYMKPGTDLPDTLHIAKEIARRNRTLAQVKNDEYIGKTRVITLTTTGSTRSITLPDGTVLKYYHTSFE